VRVIRSILEVSWHPVARLLMKETRQSASPPQTKIPRGMLTRAPVGEQPRYRYPPWLAPRFFPPRRGHHPPSQL